MEEAVDELTDQRKRHEVVEWRRIFVLLGLERERSRKTFGDLPARSMVEDPAGVEHSPGLHLERSWAAFKLDLSSG